MTSHGDDVEVEAEEGAGNDPLVRGRRGTSLYGASVEYGLHCVLWLLAERSERTSSRDLAELQGVPTAMLAKIMPRLEKAGVVTSTDGISGGYALARPAVDISVLDVVDAIEGGRRIFDCREVRRGCVLFGDSPPAWSIAGVCGIHAVMLRAERRMRGELARTSLADLAQSVRRPPEFEGLAADWFRRRSAARESARLEGMRGRRARPE